MTNYENIGGKQNYPYVDINHNELNGSDVAEGYHRMYERTRN